MSLNPLNELKRRLDDNDTALPKRLCLAKNVIKSHHFPSAPKERVVADWLTTLTKKNKLSGEDLRDVIGWLSDVKDASSEFKSKLIQIVSQYLQRNPLQKEDIPSLVSFLENSEMSTQFCLRNEECLSITITVLQYLKSEDLDANIVQSQRIFDNIVKFYKDSKKKLEFIEKLLNGENLETIFSCLESNRNNVIAVCSNILFPMNKKSFFGLYLQTLVRKDTIQDLIAEKGENVQSVLKIMDAFFAFPKGRTVTDHKFLSDFIDIFVSCYRNESQLIFAFYVMVATCLNMKQTYMSPAMKMAEIMFNENGEKIRRNLFLNMLETLLKNEVDINVKMTDTLGDKIAKVETKKVFVAFLENLMLGQLKIDKKPDKTTFQIIETALKLDPSLASQKINDILPQIMSARKSANVVETYTQMLNCLISILFRLQRGPLFLNQILPPLEIALEAGNTEQYELKEKMKRALEYGEDCEKIRNKIVTGNDIFPEKSLQLYGTLTSELLFRQNKDFLLSLQKDFEEHCLVSLEEGAISASVITLTEVLSAILSSFFTHNKMADHTVPLQIAEDFWTSFKNFGVDFMTRLGICTLKHSDEPQLLNSFLKLCLSYSKLKLLNIKYSNTKLDVQRCTSGVHELSALLPCLSDEQWAEIVRNVRSDEAVLLLDELLLIRTMATQAIENGNTEINELISPTKAYIIKHLTKHPEILENDDYLSKVLLADLDRHQVKQVVKAVVKLISNNTDVKILKNESVGSNRQLQNCLILETVKNMCKCFDNIELLAESVNSKHFEQLSLGKEAIKDMFNQISIREETKNHSDLAMYVEILRNLKIYYLEESYQLVAILMLLAVKKNCQKKLRKQVDHILLSTFELSPNPPDLYKIFPVDFIFSFKDRLLIDLLTLKIKTSNHLFIIKCLVESAVKRIKTESELVKNIVDLLLKKQSRKSGIEFFSDPSFQISCVILPSIVKQKKAITNSAYRSILADLQEKLHLSLLECFKNINFNDLDTSVAKSTTDESMVVSENTFATLNAIAAYTLTLTKYCETNDGEEFKNLDYLWKGLEYFVNNAIKAIQNPEAIQQHVESSIRLLNSILRYYKKLETHEIFQTKDKLFLQIWSSLKIRLSIVLDGNEAAKYLGFLEDVGVTLKFLCELVSVEGFNANLVSDLSTLAQFEDPSKMSKKEGHAKSTLTSHRVSKYLWTQILKAYILGPKCVALSKLIYQSSRNLKSYVQQHFESEQNGVVIKTKKKKLMVEFQEEDNEVKIVKVEDSVCEMIKIYLDTLSEAILAVKKINLDYKSLDSIFELIQSVHYILGCNSLRTRCEVSWRAFALLFDGCLLVMNGLVVSREELLEDRWPCYMQCYRSSVEILCARAAFNQELERGVEEKLGGLGHSVEKLTQSICKRKTHISRISAYTIGDICSCLERTVPCRTVRQHLEYATCLLLAAGEAPHAAAFLRRGLATAPGLAALAHARSTYRAAHKYTGNA